MGIRSSGAYLGGRSGIYPVGGGDTPFVGLLDTYSGATAAYSIRLLSSTYSGALVEIRRSSDNAVKAFYPDANNELSLTSEDGSGTSLSTWIGANNGFVRTWYDQSGNANNRVMTTVSVQPQIIASGVITTHSDGNKAITSTASQYFVDNFSNVNGSSYAYCWIVQSTSDVTQSNKTIFETPNVFNLSNGFGISFRSSKIGGYINTSGTPVNFFAGGGAISNNTTYLNALTYNTGNATIRTNGSVDMSGSGSGTIAAASGYSGISVFPVSLNSSIMAFSEYIEYIDDQSSNVTGIETNINDYFTIF